MRSQLTSSDEAPDIFELYPVNKDILVDKTRDVLRDAIVTGRFTQGQRVNETTIARQLNVSRGPIREALAGLENEGLVTRSPNRGMFVVKFTRNDVDELYALRTMYEVFALRYTIAHNRPLPIEILEEIVVGIERDLRAHPEGNEAVQADMSFHTSLITVSGLRRLIAAWSELTPQLQMLMNRRKTVGPDFAEVTGPAHADLLNALRTYDATHAEQALRTHINGSYQALIEQWTDELP